MDQNPIRKVFIKKIFYFLKKNLNWLIRPISPLPNFIIIGAQKSGTTSLYYYLIQHPSIVSAVKKEVHFFDFNYHKRINWYKGQFVSIFYKLYHQIVLRKKFITGEASPDYLFHRDVPKRIYKLLPNVKIFILLRNPIDRAYSHYNMHLKLKKHNLRFEEVLTKELNLFKNLNDLPKNVDFDSFQIRTFTILLRGIYIEQILNWLKYFPRKNMMIIESDEFFTNTRNVMKNAFKFLRVKNIQNIVKKKFMVGSYKNKIDSSVRENLRKFYKQYNNRLSEFINLEFDWN